MADVEIVIKLSEKHLGHIKKLGALWIESEKGLSVVSKAIMNGTILPKGHGELIDRKELIDDGVEKGFCDWYDEIKYAPTIIKADKLESEE